MRSRAPLALIEQVVMLAVFVLAAVLCLSCFVWADARSKDNARRDSALLELQNVAETIKYCDGDMDAAADMYAGSWDGESLTVLYDGKWNEASENAEYILVARETESESGLLGRAELAVYHGEDSLATLEICWQEVRADG
ncbi:MAG: hypothetical protein IJP23_01500 [Oscillospiraceae bacterium]|nr:hypothetical protein [Oscillospiraceae bacterium]